MGICALCIYIWFMWCNGFPEIYVWLEEGVGSICLGYMWIVLCMKLIWCNGFPEIYAHLEEGWGQSGMGICALCYIYDLFGVMVFQRSMVDWTSRVGSICHWYMWIVLYMKLIWCDGFPEMYGRLEEQGVVNLPWEYMHCVIYEMYEV